MPVIAFIARPRLAALALVALAAAVALAWRVSPSSEPEAVCDCTPPPTIAPPAPPAHPRASLRILTSDPAGLQGQAELVARARAGRCRDRADLTFRSIDPGGWEFHVLARCDDAASLQIGHRYQVLAREIPHTHTWRAESIDEARP